MLIYSKAQKKKSEFVADTCRDMIKFFSDEESQETQDALLAGYMKSCRGKQDSRV